MPLKINGSLKLFVKDVKGKEGTFKKFGSNISTKKEDGTYSNLPVDIYFNKNNYPTATTNKLESKYSYNLEITDGSTLVREWIGADGSKHVQLGIYVNECSITEPKPIKQAETKKKKDSII